MSRQGSSRWGGKGFSAPGNWAVSCPSVEERERRSSGASDLTEVGPGIQQLLCRRGKSSLLSLRPSSSFLHATQKSGQMAGVSAHRTDPWLNVEMGAPLPASPLPHPLPSSQSMLPPKLGVHPNGREEERGLQVKLRPGRKPPAGSTHPSFCACAATLAALYLHPGCLSTETVFSTVPPPWRHSMRGTKEGRIFP